MRFVILLAAFALAACNQPPAAPPEPPETTHEVAAPVGPAKVSALVTNGGLTISQGWVREPPSGAPSAAGFLTIQNAGASQDALIAVKSPRAGHVELHDMKHEGGMMMMMPVDSLVVVPEETVALTPGGKHLMFFDVPSPIKAGEEIPVTLVFAKHGEVNVTLPVNPAE